MHTRSVSSIGPRGAVAALLPVLCAQALGHVPSLDAQTPARAAPEELASPVLPSSLVRSSDWLLGALFVGSLASIQVEGLDNLDEVLGPHPKRRNAVDRWIPRNLGRFPVALGLTGATFLVGRAAGGETVARVGLRSLEALLLNTALTGAFKLGVGRARPDSGFDEDDFRPFSSGRDRKSFPSGHTSNAFALATTISRELRDRAPWVPYVAYPIAAWTGASRVLDQRHWFTDVVAGAALGVFSARLVERLNGSALALDGGGSSSPWRPRLLMQTADPLVLGVSFATH